MPERPVPGSPQEWIARAKGDLALAQAPLPEGAFYEDLCFHAQQAAEKALKSVYLHFAWAFRYVHDLEELMTGLRQRGLLVPAEVEEAVVLTSYAKLCVRSTLSRPCRGGHRGRPPTGADAGGTGRPMG